MSHALNLARREDLVLFSWRRLAPAAPGEGKGTPGPGSIECGKPDASSSMSGSKSAFERSTSTRADPIRRWCAEIIPRGHEVRPVRSLAFVGLFAPGRADPGRGWWGHSEPDAGRDRPGDSDEGEVLQSGWTRFWPRWWLGQSWWWMPWRRHLRGRPWSEPQVSRPCRQGGETPRAQPRARLLPEEDEIGPRLTYRQGRQIR